MKLASSYMRSIIVAVLTLFLFAACTKDEKPSEQNLYEKLRLVQYIENEHHRIGVYSRSGTLTVGYNDVYFQLEDKQGNVLYPASMSWLPMMYMSSGHSHSCPHADIAIADKASWFQAFAIFTMASEGDGDYWQLEFTYVLNGQSYQLLGRVSVSPSPRRTLQQFLGADGKSYVIALKAPSEPIVGINEMEVGLFQSHMGHHIEEVKDYIIKIDPRMPTMGNHGSPNNTDLTYQPSGFYKGNLSLTMTGYWRINMVLLNQLGETIKGEPITEDNESSSLYLELEF